MKFVLEGVSSQGVRLGRLLLPGSQGCGQGVETPMCLLYTRMGVVPHLTNDVLSGVSGRPPAAIVPLPTVYELPGTGVLEQCKQGIHTFLNLRLFMLQATKTESAFRTACKRRTAGERVWEGGYSSSHRPLLPQLFLSPSPFLPSLPYQDHFLYLSVQDPHAPPPQGYNQEKCTSVWTNGGRQKVTVEDHLRLVEAFQPSAFECLCDSVSSTGSKLKRIRKSVDRTLKFLDETLAARASSKVLQQCGVLGAVEGSEVLEERKRSASETAKRPVDGFVLEGFDLHPSCGSQKEVIQTVTQLLPEEKLRVIHGVCKPAEIFDAVESGVDVFDGCYPYTATEKGCALTFTHQLTEHNSRGAGGEATNTEKSEPLPLEIDLRQERFASDFTPLLEGCSCYTCLHHTRAYLHHLLATREILASVLLMTHNLIHYLQFFNSLRLSVQNSTYSQFKEVCLSQAHSDATKC